MPCGGAPWGRSASGRGAQAAPAVRLRTLAHTARWRTVAGEQNHVSTDFFASSCQKFEMATMQRPGATLRARGGPCGGTPWGRSASGHGAQAVLASRVTWQGTQESEENHAEWSRRILLTNFFCLRCNLFHKKSVRGPFGFSVLFGLPIHQYWKWSETILSDHNDTIC